MRSRSLISIIGNSKVILVDGVKKPATVKVAEKVDQAPKGQLQPSKSQYVDLLKVEAD